MIAKSDLIILAVSTTALAVGIFRWQQGTAAPRIAAAPPPPVERVVEAAPSDPATAVAGSLARRADDTAVATPESGAVRVRRVSVGGTAEAVTARRDTGAAGTTPDAAPAPVPAAIDTLAGGPSGTVGEALYGRHRIRSGDYLGKLANRFGTSVATLQSINGIEGTTIHVGEELLYPLPAN